MLTLSSMLHAVQVITSLAIIALVLLQQGKGADMGSAFGGGSAGSMFGSAGAANFLSRMTKWAAVVFFISTGALAWVGYKPIEQEAGGVMQGFESVVPGMVAPVPTVPQVPDVSVPAVPATPILPVTPEVPAAPQESTPKRPANPQADTETSGATDKAADMVSGDGRQSGEQQSDAQASGVVPAE